MKKKQFTNVKKINGATMITLTEILKDSDYKQVQFDFVQIYNLQTKNISLKYNNLWQTNNTANSWSKSK